MVLLRKVGFGSLQTLAVSLLGTAIPMVIGGLLALPAAGLSVSETSVFLLLFV